MAQITYRWVRVRSLTPADKAGIAAALDEVDDGDRDVYAALEHARDLHRAAAAAAKPDPVA